jgi:hypothetical protein
MAPARKPWWRFYSEMVDDPKLARRPPVDSWLWSVILTFARESIEPGLLLIAEGMPVTAEDLARRSRMPIKDVNDALAYFLGAPKMLRYEDDTYVVDKWNVRQYDSDRRMKGQPNDNETLFDTTTKGGPPSVICYLSSDGSKEIGVDEAFDIFWDAYPLKRGKEDAHRAFAKALTHAEFDVILAGAKRYHEEQSRPDAPNTKYPQGWLSGSRWDDDPLPFRASNLSRKQSGANAVMDEIKREMEAL